jgi:O-antigen/teichoic acid export membrane protein
LANQVEPAKDGRTALLTTVDQILSSASNALLLFAIAQVSTEAEFGAVGLLAIFFSTVLGFNRGALGSPILLVSALSRPEILAEAGYALTWAIGTGAVAGLCVALTAVYLGVPTLALVLAVSVPLALCQDVLRYLAIAIGRPSIAVLADGAWVLLLLIIYGINAVWAAVSAPFAILAWGAGGLVAAVVLIVSTEVRPRFRRVLSWWRTYAAARIRFGLVYALTLISATVVTFIVALTIGSAAVAGIRGAVALFGPISMLISAVPLVFIPRAKLLNELPRTQWRPLRTAALVSSALTLAIALSLRFLPAGLGSALLGPTWYSAAAMVPYIGAESASVCWLVAAYTLFQSLGMSRLLLYLRAAQVGLQLSIAVAAAVLIKSAVAVAAALALSAGLMAVLSVVAAAIVLRRSGAEDIENVAAQRLAI